MRTIFLRLFIPYRIVDYRFQIDTSPRIETVSYLDIDIDEDYYYPEVPTLDDWHPSWLRLHEHSTVGVRPGSSSLDLSR